MFVGGDCQQPAPLPPPPDQARGRRQERRRRAVQIQQSALPAAPPGPGPGTAARVAEEKSSQSPVVRPPRRPRARPGESGGEEQSKSSSPPSPRPPPSFCTFITIPPAAIVKPQEFLVRCVSHQGATGVHIHLTLSHASHRPTNLFDSPPAERDTCCLSQRTQESPSEPPRWSARPSLPPPASSRCWSLSGVSLDTTTGVPPRCRRRGGRGPSDCTTTPPPHPTPPHPHPTNPTPPHTAHTHMHSPYHDPWPPPPMRGQAPLDRGTPLPHLIP